jgi:ADP-ribose pyrophosphatase YjhB (NUDIX family)
MTVSDAAATTLSPERSAILAVLEKKMWWNATSHDVKAALMALPEGENKTKNFNGYLADLAARPEVVGNVQQLSILSAKSGNYGVITMFQVKPLGRDEHYTYEYFSWFTGPMAGAKGAVFVKDSTTGRVTHCITSITTPFATAWRTAGMYGGFVENGESLNDNALRELREELGTDELDIDVIPLGTMLTDQGMTNNRPGVFIAFIKSDQVSSLPSNPVNTDAYELESTRQVFPIEQLSELIETVEDPFFQTSVLRALGRGLLPHYVLDSYQADL